MRAEPSVLDKDEIKRGSNIVALFSDNSRGRKNSETFGNLKKETILMAIQDIASGGIGLSASSFGVCQKNKDLHQYILPLGTQPDGECVFSISLKKSTAFKGWRNGETTEMSQEDINSTMYYLIHELSLL